MRVTDQPSSTWRLGRVAGADILVKPSMFVMGAIMVLLFAPTFERIQQGNPYLAAALFVLVLYASVFLHELAHLIAARKYGMRVQSLTLHLLGGETQIAGESRTPAQEVVTSGVGPVTSLCLGSACLFAAGLVELVTVSSLFWVAGFVNIILGIFNLLPGYPLDGGRVLRGAIWAASGNEATGYRVTAWSGRVTVLIGAIWAAWAVRFDGPADVVRLVVVLMLATILWSGASYAAAEGRRRRQLEHLSIDRFIVLGAAPPDAVRLPYSLSGSSLLRHLAAQPAQVYAVVAPDGTVVGRLYTADVERAVGEGPP